MNYMLDVTRSYRLVWIKAALLIVLPALTLFDSYTETWSQADWKAQSDFSIIRLGVKMFIASASVYIAWIDKSLGRAADDFSKRRRERAETEHVEKGKI